MGKNYIKYSGMAMSMAASLLLFAALGTKIDNLLQLKYPIFLSILSIASIAVSTYAIIKKVL
jgi:hypothetical protein